MSIRCCLLAAGLFVCASAGISTQFSPFVWNSSVPFSKNTIDFRYPNYIVEPLVECPTEGVFPHPHDCTWYYRCHERYNFSEMGIFGMYWRSYYQCEPGTEFLDSLDQCVFRGDAKNCKKEVVCTHRFNNCYTKQLCDNSAIGSSVVQGIEYCEGAFKVCSDQPMVSLCPKDSYYDKTNDKCIEKSAIDNCKEGRPQTDFDKQPNLCVDVMESCIDLDVCREGGERQVERLCELNRKCYGPKKQATVQHVCPADHMFNALSNRCVPTPKKEDACVGIPDTGKKPVGSCTKQIEHCSVRPDCDSLVSTLVCTGVFMCGNNVLRSSLCQSPDEVYVPKLGRCSSMHTSLQRESEQCVATLIPPKPYIDQYRCKEGETTVPWAKGHPDLRCSQRELCDESGESPSRVTVVGCDSYFKCRGVGRPVKLTCPGSQFFDYDRMKCVDFKTEYGGNHEYCIGSSTEVVIKIDVECKTDGEIPVMKGDTLKLNCIQETICEGNYDQITLCDNYYKCVKQSNDVLKPIKQQCPEGESFNPEKSMCQKVPDNLCSARQLLLLHRLNPSA